MIKAEIKDKELKEHLDSLEADKLRIFTMADGRVRGALFHGSRFVNQMRAQHNLGILETMILGQAGLCAALIIPMMKDREHTVIKYEGTGSAEGYSLEADSTGYVRGYLYNEHIKLEKPLESWDLKPFLGVGNLTFSRVHPDDKYPQSSTVDVDDGNIAKDFAWYFSQSEQLKTAFNTSVQFDKQGRVVGAGAMYLQIMPKTGGTKKIGSQVDSHQEESEDEEDLIRRVENAFTACPSLGQLYSEKTVDSEDIILGLFREFAPTITLSRDIIFDCKCNEESYLNYLKNLPAKEKEAMKKDGLDPVEIVCRNCGSVYRFPLSSI
ncbi:MAG: Hsp33 family molecular chaperone HslO [Treponema sp.]|nr:Hsp33 family molecular chaperone HslO [Treponema sp.]